MSGSSWIMAWAASQSRKERLTVLALVSSQWERFWDDGNVLT